MAEAGIVLATGPAGFISKVVADASLTGEKTGIGDLNYHHFRILKRARLAQRSCSHGGSSNKKVDFRVLTTSSLPFRKTVHWRSYISELRRASLFLDNPRTYFASNLAGDEQNVPTVRSSLHGLISMQEKAFMNDYRLVRYRQLRPNGGPTGSNRGRRFDMVKSA